MEKKRQGSTQLLGILVFAVIVGILFLLSESPSPHTKDLTCEIDGVSFLIQLADEGGYDLRQRDNFYIYRDDLLLCDCGFVDAGYETYKTDITRLASDGDDMRVLECGEKDGREYLLWKSADGAFHIGLDVGHSGKTFVLWCIESMPDIKECLNRLTVTIVE